MLFSCDLVTEPSIQKKLERIHRIKSIIFGPLCLPNIHKKDKLESPPQFVVGTKDTIVPMLSAPAMNCGMSVFITDLSREDFSEEFLSTFAVRMRDSIGPRVSRLRALWHWLGIYPKKQTSYDLTVKELEDVFLRGAAAAVEKYRLPKEELEHIEYRGSMLTEEERHTIDLKKLVPRSSYTNGRHEMGYNFGGNHFLEFHAVERILDQEKARTLGLREGTILLFYHGGGGHATYHLGRYFARRIKNTFFQKSVLFWLKIFFHFGSVEGLRNARARWQYYFSRKPYPEIPLNTDEGRRLWQSIKIALNYGYAFRVALLRRINDALPKGNAHFFWDAAHNSITEEMIDTTRVIVHRQDAVRIFPEKPIMITGLATTLGYIGVGGAEGAKTMWSCTPSATQVIEEHIRSGKSIKESPTHVSFISKRKEAGLIKKEHLTSEGLFEVVEKFEKEHIIEPVAVIRPLGGLKGH